MNPFKRIYYKRIKKIFVRTGAMVWTSELGYRSQISPHSLVMNSNIGPYTSIGRNSTVLNADIGKFCSISWNVTVGATSHHLDRMSTHAFPYIKDFGFAAKTEKIVVRTAVGNDVWIAANVIIMPGITIGDGAVIGAGSIVTKNVEPYSVYLGSPARKIKNRFSPEVTTRLQEIKWWEWDEDKIRRNLQKFQEVPTVESLNDIK